MSYHTCWVGNLDLDVDDKSLNDLFQEFGKIMSISVVQKKTNAKFAFINYETKEEAENASKTKNGAKLNGKEICTNYKPPKIQVEKVLKVEKEEIIKTEEEKKEFKTKIEVSKDKKPQKFSPKKNSQEELTTRCYTDKKLKGCDEKNYKSAGIFATLKVKDKIYALFGLEFNHDEKTPSLSILGGKREYEEKLKLDKDSMECAAREFYEESGMLLDKNEIYNTICKNEKVLWICYGKYALYFMEDFVKEDIVEEFLKKGDKAEVQELVWIPIDDLKMLSKENHIVKLKDRELRVSVYCRRMINDVFRYIKF